MINKLKNFPLLDYLFAILTPTKRFVSLLVLAILGFAYIAWQLMGLRYTNHDDIFFNLLSWIHSEDYFNVGKGAAFAQARIHFYINIPVSLWILHYANSYFFDVLNIGSFGIFYICMILLIAKMDNLINALILAYTTLLLFPLHYYFTFPQGYPVVFMWSLSFACISAGLLASYLQCRNIWKLIISVMLFTLSLNGEEYNFILHPALLVFVLFSQKDYNIKLWLRTSVPYAACWITSIIIYLLFFTIAHASGGNANGRVSLGLNIIAWVKTFFALQIKAFLPFALSYGIGITSPTIQGTPTVPTRLNFSNILHETRDFLSILIIFTFTFIIFVLILYYQKLQDKKTLRLYFILFSSLIFIPSFVLAGSALYQEIVLKGYIQGHPVTFYSQLGFSGLLFLILAYICNIQHKKVFRGFAVVLSATILASLASVTFIYNNVNRQLMSANRQKWEAMNIFTKFIYEGRPDLREKNFYAPEFWSTIGVSGIPDVRSYSSDGANYWSTYTKTVLNMPLKIMNLKNNFSDEDDVLFIKYFSIPSGTPIVLLNERNRDDYSRQITLIASKPIQGTIYYESNGNNKKRITSNEWSCTSYCVAFWSEQSSLKENSIDFEPYQSGAKRLLAQFVTRRNGAFAHPFENNSIGELINNFNTIKVNTWGPKETTLGIIPNSLPDGGAGISINLSNQKNFGNVEVLFAGKPIPTNIVNSELITISVPIHLLNTLGEKEILLKQTKTGATLFVGNFKVK